MKAATLTLYLFLLTHISFAEYQITGQVSDIDGSPLLGVNIYIKDSYDGASSDIDGKFIFKTSHEGAQTIIASFIGFKTYETTVEIFQDTFLTIVLVEEINKIDGVTISAGAFEASDKKKSVVLKTLDIVSTAGATADITGVMNTLPGTQTVGEEGRLFVRGGASHEAKTFINGLLVSEPYGPTAQNIPSRFRFSPFLFKGAFFSTGGYSAEYGQALSSVLQLKTYELPARSQTDISIMTVGGDISRTIRKNNTSIYGQVQYTDLTGYYSIVPQKYEWKRAPNSINSTIHFKQKLGDVGSIQAYTNFNKSGTVLYQPTPGNFYVESKYDLNTQSVYSNVAFNNSLGETASYRGGFSYSDNINIMKMEDLNIVSRSSSYHSKLVVENDITENVLIKYGAEWVFSKYDELVQDSEFQAGQKLNYKNHLFSSFIESEIYYSNNLMARIGGRYEFNSLTGNHALSPRASLAYKIKKYSQFSLAYGRFRQLPISDYLKFTHQLDDEKASHYILNYQYSNDGRILRTEAYFKKYDDLVTKQESNPFAFVLGNEGYGEAKGIELFWRDSKTWQNVDYWISYSFLDTERKYDAFSMPVMPYYASAHNLSIVYKHFISSIKSQIGWTYSFASGRPYTDPNTGKLNSQLTKNYHDLSINYSYLIKPNMIIHASVSNVLGFSNVFGYQFNSEPNEQGIYESIPIEPQAKRFLFIGFFITISKDKNANQLNNL